MTDATLSFFNTCLQWIAVVGTTLGLISAIGSIFTSSELPNRSDTKLNEARSEAKIANLKIAAIKQEQSPWQFSSEQESQLAEILKNAPKCKLELNCAESDSPRSVEFSRVLRPILNNLGYDIEDETGMFMNNGQRPVEGILIEFGDEENRDAAMHLVGALIKIGIPSKWYFRKPHEKTLVPWLKGIVTISIGDKPKEISEQIGAQKPSAELQAP